MATNSPFPQDPTPAIEDPNLIPPVPTPNPEDLGAGVRLGDPEDPEERNRPETIRDRW
jgi:hypothetical protein